MDFVKLYQREDPLGKKLATRIEGGTLPSPRHATDVVLF